MTAPTLALLFLLGLGLSAAPGALNVETARRGLRDGFGPALTVQVGALLGDAIWVGAAGLVLAVGLPTSLVAPACLVLGGSTLLWTAWRILAPSAARRPRHLAAPAGLRARHRGLAFGAALAVSSPLTMVFWAAVQTMLHEQLGRSATPGELGAVAAVYVAGVLVWGVGLAAVTAAGRRLVRPGAGRLLNLGCALLLALWGVQLLGRAAAVLA